MAFKNFTTRCKAVFITAAWLTSLLTAGVTHAETASIDAQLTEFINQAHSDEQIMTLITARSAHPEFTPLKSSAEVMRFLKNQTQALAVHVSQKIAMPESVQNLWIAHGVLAKLTPSEIRVLSLDSQVESLHAMNGVSHLTRSTHNLTHDLWSYHDVTYTYGLTLIGVPQVRTQDPTRDGRGIRVGILDTGVDATHPALAGRVALFKDYVGNQTVPYDDFGHGTHVAGTIAGTIAGGEYVGVAPGVTLQIGKVYDSMGQAQDSNLLLGMQWMADPNGNSDLTNAPVIVSCSWDVDAKANSEDPAQEPFCKAVDSWVRLGIIPVFAAGNDGPSGSTIGIPGACPGTVAVAATDEQDAVADFSSRGPAAWKTTSLNKPDIAAPGVDIDSLAPGGETKTMDGTSMATPHVAGSLALLLQGLPPDARVANNAKAVDALLKGANPLGNTGFSTDVGSGRVDLVHSLSLMH